MIWATTHSYELANHPPYASLDVPNLIRVVPQQRVPLFGSATDPDGDALLVKWWLMPNGTYQNPVKMEKTDGFHPVVIIPEGAKTGESYHIIMEIKDSGTPSLTTYKRIVLKVLD